MMKKKSKLKYSNVRIVAGSDVDYYDMLNVDWYKLALLDKELYEVKEVRFNQNSSSYHWEESVFYVFFEERD